MFSSINSDNCFFPSQRPYLEPPTPDSGPGAIVPASCASERVADRTAVDKSIQCIAALFAFMASTPAAPDVASAFVILTLVAHFSLYSSSTPSFVDTRNPSPLSSSQISVNYGYCSRPEVALGDVLTRTVLPAFAAEVTELRSASASWFQMVSTHPRKWLKGMKTH